MAIKPLPQSIPTKLPPAKLYLDDVTEILQILTDSSTDYQASFVAGKSKCDTLDDLKDLKGRATHFVMDISSPGKHQTIFEKRKLKLKSVVRSMASWILAGLWLLTGALLMFVPRAGKPTSIHELTNLATAILLAAAVVYYFVSSHSIVYLRYPQRVAAGRWLEDHKPEIIVGFICILMGAISTRIVEKVWK